jgi:predicted MPP superfamily phosphohydrolase
MDCTEYDIKWFGPASLQICIFLLFALGTVAQESPFKVFLVGDAGEDAVTGPTLKNLQALLAVNPNSAVVFLGDNSYKSTLDGIIPFGFKGFDSSSLTQKKIRSQLDILNGYGGSAYFIPGNHDWWNRKSYKRGRGKLKMEQSFIQKNLEENKSMLNPDNTFFPKDGSPGPEFVELNHNSVRIIFLDTYRMILPGFKKDRPDTALSEKKFYNALDLTIKEAFLENQRVIVVAHHPVYLHGPHSEPLKNYTILSRIKASNMNFPSYKEMSIKIRAILQKYPGIYFASGHVHGLHYAYTADSIHYIISGAGSKIQQVSQKEMEKYTTNREDEFSMWNNKGFFEIEFYPGRERIFLYYDEGKQVCELL